MPWHFSTFPKNHVFYFIFLSIQKMPFFIFGNIVFDGFYLHTFISNYYKKVTKVEVSHFVSCWQVIWLK
jgi:hypothetical protein